MAVLKKPVKKIEKQEKIPMFHIGDKVMFEDDGKKYHGEVTEVDNDSDQATVEVPDDGAYQVPFNELKSDVEDAKPVKSLKTPIGRGAAKSVNPVKAGAGDDFASAFNKVNAASSGGASLPPGKHNCVAIELGLRDSDKGLSGFVKYTVLDAEDAANDASGVAFYQLLNSEGEPQEGFSFFKRDLVLLGMDEDTVLERRSDLEEILESLASKELYVEVTVREKNGYTNIFLNQLLDQDEKP